MTEMASCPSQRQLGLVKLGQIGRLSADGSVAGHLLGSGVKAGDGSFIMEECRFLGALG